LSRLLTEHEIEAYLRFADFMPESGRGTLLEQLRRVTVINETVEHTTFSPLEDCAGIEDLPSNFMAFYDDLDGETVHMTFAFVPPGVASWVDRYRVDHRPIQNPSPRASDIRFTVNSPNPQKRIRRPR
jgi:hypothetical protein